MRINPNRRTSNERLIIINIDVTIPRKGNTGNLPMAIGTLNPSFTGFLYLKYINEALITINTAKIVKFVRFATVFKSPRNKNNIDAITTATIAAQGVLNLFNTEHFSPPLLHSAFTKQ